MALPPFYDTHAHLDFPDFQNDLPDLIARAREQGVEKIITIGTDLESSRRSLRIAESYPDVYAVVGWHPNHATEAPEDIRDELEQLARHPKVVGIGETGIDRYRLPEVVDADPAEVHGRLLAKQARLFEQQLEVASRLGLNCVIHQRAALEDTLQILTPWLGRTQGVFHCFVDGAAAARRVLDLGCWVSFTGILTFKSAVDVRASLEAAPVGRFMLETDCPFLAPTPYRGKRCEPSYVPHTAAVMATTKGLELEAVSEATCRAAKIFFPGIS